MKDRSEENSYVSILKTTGLIGLVQVIGIVLGLFRTKVIALLLGASGFGIFSLYNGILEFANTSSQFGAGTGGIRLLAEKQAQDDKKAIGQIIFILRFWIIITSSLFLLLMLIFAKEISFFQFHSNDQISGIRILAFAVVFGNLYNIHLAILNGTRRIRQMALCQIISAISGVVIALPILFYFREKGIEISILVLMMINFLISFFYIKQSGFHSLWVDWRLFRTYFNEIMKVGLSYAIPGVLATCLVYFSRVYLKEYFSFQILGVYQACITLSTIYVQTILTAMGVDFLPRIIEVKDNNQLVNQKINEQMELGVLIGSVGVFATFILAPYLLQLLYSSQFVSGSFILRCQIIAVFFKLLEWPLGFTTTAKGENLLYLKLQVSYVLFELAILIVFSQIWGLVGLAISYLVSYSLFFLVRYYTVNRMTGFRFSNSLKKLLFACMLLLFMVANCILFLSPIWGVGISLVLFGGYVFWEIRFLKNHMGLNVMGFIRSKVFKN